MIENQPPTSTRIFGDTSRFSVVVTIDEEHDGVWLNGKIAYVIDGMFVGDYEQGTSLRDVLLQMGWILSDSGRRRTERFVGESKENLIQKIRSCFFGCVDPAIDEVSINECWAKHNITIPVDVFDGCLVLQFDENCESRLIWSQTTGLTDAAASVVEVRVPLGTTELVFSSLFDYLNTLLSFAEGQEETR